MICHRCVFCSPDFRRLLFHCRRREVVPCRKSLCIAQRFQPKFFLRLSCQFVVSEIRMQSFVRPAPRQQGFASERSAGCPSSCEMSGFCFGGGYPISSSSSPATWPTNRLPPIAAHHRRGQEQRQPNDRRRASRDIDGAASASRTH